MIEPLTDIHTGIEAPKLKPKFDAPLRQGTDRAIHGNIDRFAKSGRRELAAITNRAYLRGAVLSPGHGEWQFGWTDGGIGYLRILSFEDYGRYGGLAGNIRALNRALDRILGDPKLRGLRN